MIKAFSSEYHVNTLCKALDVAKDSYYNHLLRNKKENTKAANKQSKMTPIIEQIFHENNEVFGNSKIYAILKTAAMLFPNLTVAKNHAPKRLIFNQSMRQNTLQATTGAEEQHITTAIPCFPSQ